MLNNLEHGLTRTSARSMEGMPRAEIVFKGIEHGLPVHIDPKSERGHSYRKGFQALVVIVLAGMLAGLVYSVVVLKTQVEAQGIQLEKLLSNGEQRNQTVLDQNKQNIAINTAALDGNTQATIALSTEDVRRNNETIQQHILDHSAYEASTSAELDQHTQAIDANAAAIKSAREEIKRAHMESSANLVKLERQLNKNITQVRTAILAKRAAGECKTPLPGSEALGAFVDPMSMNWGRTAIDRRCQDGKTYENPFGADITYDVPDAIDMVTHHAETDATASVRAFSTLDQWKRARMSSSIGIAGVLSLGSSTETQTVREVMWSRQIA